MPRAKKKAGKPSEVFTVDVDGEKTVFEIWENPADEGTRGAHMQRKRYEVLDAVLNHCEAALSGQSTISKNKIDRLIKGQDSLAEFGRIVVTIAKIKNIKIGQTLSEEIAQRVRNHYKAIEAALANQAAEKKLPP